MKKIINGRQYDTDKAQYMGGDSGGEGFSHWSEELYQKRTGEFFLHGEGGALTKYAEYEGDNRWHSGEDIIPLSLEAAREWGEKHLDGDAWESIFGAPVENAEPVALNLQIRGDLMARLRMLALERGQTLTACVEAVMEAGLEKVVRNA